MNFKGIIIGILITFLVIIIIYYMIHKMPCCKQKKYIPMKLMLPTSPKHPIFKNTKISENYVSLSSIIINSQDDSGSISE
jgi:hypothetical protein